MAEDNSTKSNGSGGGGNKLVMILTVVNLLATIGIIGLLLSHFKKQQHAQVTDIDPHAEQADASAGNAENAGKEDAAKSSTEKFDPERYGKMIALEPFTVNLSTAGTVSPRFVRVEISVEVGTEDAEKEFSTRMPQVRNTIIDLFNSKRPNDIANTEGQNYLKDEIKNAINAFLVSGKIKGVYFTSWNMST